MPGVRIGRQPCETTETQLESHEKMEAEIGVVQPQAKECLRLPQAVSGKEESSPRGFRECVTQVTP